VSAQAKLVAKIVVRSGRRTVAARGAGQQRVPVVSLQVLSYSPWCVRDRGEVGRTKWRDIHK
jgi:hypothetical protein